MGNKGDLFVVAFCLILLHKALGGLSLPCSNGQCKLLESCSSNSDCGAGLHCFSCQYPRPSYRCVRSTATNPFTLVNNSLPFNKYAFLTTHNSFAIQKAGQEENKFPTFTLTNQEDNLTQQLNNGVRALMLDIYEYEGDVWLCHSFKGKCHAFTAFQRAIDAFKEIEAFMCLHPSAIVTLILEDYVTAPNGIRRLLKESGLMNYRFPLSRMPKNGEDWPVVRDMVNKNQRLIVFTSMRSKEESEGIAYQWNYMVENQFGSHGMEPGRCPKRNELSSMNDQTKSLVLVNHFKTIPSKLSACKDNSGALIQMLQTCYVTAGERWANFVAVDYYKRSDGGGAFQAIDTLNGERMCGRSDVHECVTRFRRTIPSTLSSNQND